MEIFEKKIIKSLMQNYHYSEDIATKTVKNYQEAMEKSDMGLNAEEWAEQLDFAMQNRITAKKWMNRIRKIERDIKRNYNR